MSEKGTLISPENLQTVVAVCFVLTLLSLGVNFYNFNRTSSVFGNIKELSSASTERDDALLKRIEATNALQTRVDALEKKLAEMEKMAAAPPE